MSESMVLRFRDFIDETIPEHKKLISEYSYVWWGWWNKPNEHLPVNIFSQINKQIKKSGPIEIFLVHSGIEQLYSATLEEIKFSTSMEKIACPEKDITPNYYNEEEYYA